ALNAFATGRDPEHSAVAVTRGLLEKLNRTELEGVISHEISHIKNYDIRLATIIVTLVGVVALISDWMLRSLWWGRSGRNRRRDGGAGLIFFVIGIVLAILSPLIAQLIRFSISREREFLADADGALISRYPEGLASALEKIASDENVLKTATNATAHLFISNPLKTKRKRKSNLFSTHPPIAERIEKLRSL
ncbi:MAG: M48 family metallopeptidase, partial [Actinomycetia bacterium]|nr:M48 family metallopeptidase [Actinomycetes bacterium]